MQTKMSSHAIEYQREQIKREMAMRNDKKWEIVFRDLPWKSIHQGQASEGFGYYEILYEGNKYGFISEKAWDEQKTGDILQLVEQMLNDAYNLARGIRE
jgi:hypothetical protein